MKTFFALAYMFGMEHIIHVLLNLYWTGWMRVHIAFLYRPTLTWCELRQSILIVTRVTLQTLELQTLVCM